MFAAEFSSSAVETCRSIPLEVINRLTSRFDEEEAIELKGPGPIFGDLTSMPIKNKVAESGSI
jgi:hypothetical protein